jgi:GGDEF domain-containing protein
MGGDEFLCLLPKATGFDDRQVRDRLNVRLSRLASDAREPFPITATMGTATADAMSPAELDDLIRDADEALYARKHRQGEESVVFGPAPDA